MSLSNIFKICNVAIRHFYVLLPTLAPPTTPSSRRPHPPPRDRRRRCRCQNHKHQLLEPLLLHVGGCGANFLADALLIAVAHLCFKDGEPQYDVDRVLALGGDGVNSVNGNDVVYRYNGARGAKSTPFASMGAGRSPMATVSESLLVEEAPQELPQVSEALTTTASTLRGKFAPPVRRV